MVYWFKDGSTNITGGDWNNTISGNVVGLLQGDAVKSGSAAFLDNSSSTLVERDQRFNIKTTSGTVNVQSALYLFNQPVSTGVGGALGNYFCGVGLGDFSDYFSLDTLDTDIYGVDATFFGYVEGQVPVNGGIVTQELMTDGLNNPAGGSGELQWLGPNGTSANTTKRIFFFNYNSTVPMPINDDQGLKIGSDRTGNFGTSMGLYEMIGFNRTLSFIEFQDLVKYLKNTNVIN